MYTCSEYGEERKLMGAARRREGIFWFFWFFRIFEPPQTRETRISEGFVPLASVLVLVHRGMNTLAIFVDVVRATGGWHWRRAFPLALLPRHTFYGAAQAVDFDSDRHHASFRNLAVILSTVSALLRLAPFPRCYSLESRQLSSPS